jgi:hypothetical protein
MIYRCPVGADNCGDHTTPGYCGTHGTMLERVRALMAPPAVEPPAQVGVDFGRPHVALEFLGRSVPVPPDGLLIGREQPPLRDLPGMAELTQVSRRHARLLWLADKLYVEDVGSKNGTFVDGDKVTTRRRLGVGQQLRLALDVIIPVVTVDVDEFGLPR